MSQEVTYPAVTVNTSGSATAANQTNGDQKTQIVDGSGNVVGTTSNALDVNIAGGSVSNSANGATGSAVPTDATQVGGSDGTNLRALSVNASGQLNVNNISGTVSLPTGAATAANQTTGNASLSSIDGKTPALVTGRVPVDGSGVTQPVSGTVAVSNFPATQPISGTVAATQSGTWNLNDISGTVSLPTGAATAANQTSGGQKSQIVDGSGNVIASTANALNVNISSGTATVTGTVAATQSGTWTVQPGNTANTTAWLVTQNGRSQANAPVRNDYSSVNVTTGAYVQLVASLTATCNEIEIFDSSGQTLYLATGGSGSETNQIIIFPGGNGRIPLRIASGTRVSIKSITATASAGAININFYT